MDGLAEQHIHLVGALQVLARLVVAEQHQFHTITFMYMRQLIALEAVIIK
jgi:hypothetical protein